MPGPYHRNPMPPLTQPYGTLLSEEAQIAVLQERSLANSAAIQNMFAVHSKSEDACNANMF